MLDKTNSRGNTEKKYIVFSIHKSTINSKCRYNLKL